MDSAPQSLETGTRERKRPTGGAGDTARIPVAEGEFLRDLLWLLVLAGAAVLVFAPTIRFGFLQLDDDLLIVRRVQWLGDPHNAPLAFREGVFPDKAENFYRPILTLSFMLDTIIGGGKPWAYHLTNVVLHAGATVLLAMTLVRLGARRATARALGLVFAVHPAATATVAFLAGRNDSLLAISVLASTLAFEEWLTTGRVRYLALHGLALAAAMLTKETAALFPLVCLIGAWMRHRSSICPRALVACGGVWLASVGGPLALGRLLLPPSPVPPVSAAAVIDFGRALIVSLGKIVLPIGQSVLPVMTDSPLLPGILAAVLIVVAARWIEVRRLGAVVFGLVWSLSFLAPPTAAGSLGVVMRIHHEHRLYLPLMGFAIAASGVGPLTRSWTDARLRGLRRGFGALVLLLAAVTIVRGQRYADPLAFGEAAVRESPSAASSWKARGAAFLEAKRTEEAISDLERALMLRPGWGSAVGDLAKAWFDSGDFEKALVFCHQAISADPGDIEQRNNRAAIYLAMDKTEDAVTDLDWVLDRAPNNSKALNNRGRARIYAGKNAEALADLTRAIAVRPDDGEAYHNRAVAYFNLRDYDRAWNDVRKADSLGVPIVPGFLAALRRASGR